MNVERVRLADTFYIGSHAALICTILWKGDTLLAGASATKIGVGILAFTLVVQSISKRLEYVHWNTSI